MEKPKTISRFRRFSRELYEVEYPAPGSPGLAQKQNGGSTATEVGLDHEWGLDHGCWSVLRHLFPDAGVPVIELSL